MRKQRAVAISSTEAEIYAASLAAAHVTWVRRFLAGCGIMFKEATVLYEDNAGAISMSHDPTQHSKAKHISIKQMFIRSKVLDGEIKPIWVATNENIADMMTKVLARPAFLKYRDQLMGETA